MTLGKNIIFISIFVSINIIFVYSQVEISATPSDTGNLRHPLAPAPVAPPRPTPSASELALINATNATVPQNMTPVVSVPVPMAVNVTTLNATITNATLTPAHAPITNATIPSTVAVTTTTTTSQPGTVITSTVIPVGIPMLPLILTNISLTNQTNQTQSLIPELFFVNRDGDRTNQTERVFIILKTLNNELLDCNVLGNLTAITGKLTPDNLFVPVAYNQTTISLRSYHGGYIGFSNNTFDCTSRKLGDNAYLQVENFLNATNFTFPTNVTLNNTVAFKNQNGYLAVVNGNVTLAPSVNQSVVFVPK